MNTVGVGAGGGAVGTGVGEGMGVDVLTGVLVGKGVGVGGVVGMVVGDGAAASAGVDVSDGLGVGVSDGLDGNAAMFVANGRVGCGGKIPPKTYTPRPAMHANARRTPTITPINDKFRPSGFSICSLRVTTVAVGGRTGFGAISVWILAMSESTSL